MLSTILLVIASILLFFYFSYRWALPRPIPGIPYNASSAGKVLGDVPDLLNELALTGDMVQWLLKQNLKTQSPISQIFVQPLGKPYVLVSDWRAARDVMMHRSKEFDRSSLITNLFEGLLRRQQFTLQTGAEWRAHRFLVQDTMTPAFLNKMCAPAIYARSLDMVKLWTIKERLAGGRPFRATDDIFHATFDAVNSFSFGEQFQHSSTRPHIELLEKEEPERIQEGQDINAPVEFPKAHIDPSLDAMLELSEIMEAVKNAPSPSLQWRWTKLTRSFRQHTALKDACLRTEISKAVLRAQRRDERGTPAGHEEKVEEPSTSTIRSGIDVIIDRETRVAAKEQRAPDYTSQPIMDELFGFVVAGHDTMSTTLCWAVKFLADNPGTQTKLRQALRVAHAAAVNESRAPAAEEIASARIPYLEAVMEEVLRCGLTVPIGDREVVAESGADLLGYRIPKGVIVFFLHNGPGMRIPESDANIAKYGTEAGALHGGKKGGIAPWSDDDITNFKPERWLSDDGSFDAQAGPSMPFGLGIRACFGKRLAYLEFRILLTMMMWHFSLGPCPEELSGYAGQLAVVHKPRVCYVRLESITK
ncbi:cytochrome P450 [Pseudovirgaria hyperparasitica]|uniref:Cytochrome P450 n=1 Tax=Pseudovirgaria hyperparasitica TaxID=470096 RepID=A0A6A6WIA7_9PEZI|nr:cytochrome P450 [Pseudovirgaria hyperparasitica]KAF2761845.1 cytochrome P450 [Pseudovirgaria hyperparasitica]